MDAIGTLAAFAPGDLARLEYITIQTTTEWKYHTIPSSKFIIAFPSNMYYDAQQSPVMVISKGMPENRTQLVYDNLRTVNISFSGSSIGIKSSNASICISIAYCPV